MPVEVWVGVAIGAYLGAGVGMLRYLTKKGLTSRSYPRKLKIMMGVLVVCYWWLFLIPSYREG